KAVSVDLLCYSFSTSSSSNGSTRNRCHIGCFTPEVKHSGCNSYWHCRRCGANSDTFASLSCEPSHIVVTGFRLLVELDRATDDSLDGSARNNVSNASIRIIETIRIAIGIPIPMELPYGIVVCRHRIHAQEPRDP